MNPGDVVKTKTFRVVFGQDCKNMVEYRGLKEGKKYTHTLAFMFLGVEKIDGSEDINIEKWLIERGWQPQKNNQQEKGVQHESSNNNTNNQHESSRLAGNS